MKIGIVTDAIDDGDAGISQYTQMIVRHLRALHSGHEIVLIHHRRHAHPAYEGAKQLIVPLKRVPFAREYRKVVQLPRILERQGFDVVHDTTQVGPFFRRSRFKKVVTVHDLGPLRFPHTTASLAQRIHHRVGLPWVMRRVDAVIAVSRSTADEVEHFFASARGKVHVIPEALVERDSTGAADDGTVLSKYGIASPYFLFLGTLEPRKNIVRVLEALARVPQARLVVAGKAGWKFRHIFERVRRLGLDGRVSFTGFVPDEDVGALYRNAQAFVWPSLYEGFGLPVLEAMHYGCPVVTSSTSSLPQVAGDAAILVDPMDVGAIAQAMRDVGDKKTAAMLRKRGAAQVARFSWERAARETMRVYDALAPEVSS